MQTNVHITSSVDLRTRLFFVVVKTALKWIYFILIKNVNLNIFGIRKKDILMRYNYMFELNIRIKRHFMHKTNYHKIFYIKLQL